MTESRNSQKSGRKHSYSKTLILPHFLHAGIESLETGISLDQHKMSFPYIKMRTTLHACVALTCLATVLACAPTEDLFDKFILAMCAVIQLGFLVGCIHGAFAHVAFVTAVSYSALFGGRTLLLLSVCLLALTLALRLFYGGCIFNAVEGNSQLKLRKTWTADIQLLSLLLISTCRLILFNACTISTPWRLMGAACVVLYIILYLIQYAFINYYTFLLYLSLVVVAGGGGEWWVVGGGRWWWRVVGW